MTPSARCPLTDLPVYSCGHCTGAQARARAAEAHTPLPPGTRATARYPGRCPACDEPIQPGEMITASEDGWLCPGCG